MINCIFLASPPPLWFVAWSYITNARGCEQRMSRDIFLYFKQMGTFFDRSETR